MGFVIAVVVIAVVLSGALTPPATFVVFVHAYDKQYGDHLTIEQLSKTMLVGNVTVTVSGAPDQPTRFTPTGIIAYDQLHAGTYNITLTANGYASKTITYLVGPSCVIPLDGNCHALVPITKTT